MSKHAITWVVVFGMITLMFLKLPQMAATQDVVVNTYSALVEVDALTRQEYVEPIDPQRLVDGAIRGMMLQLDPYSGYISPQELASFERRSRGGYVGVGIFAGIVDGRPTVIAPVAGSPAARAGVRPGDMIISVGGLDVAHRSIFEIEELLTGRPSTPVTLRVHREAAKEPLTLTMMREPIHVVSVRGIGYNANGDADYFMDPDWRIAYLRVSSFHEGTGEEFVQALDALTASGARALVLDLRFNPGGIMQQAVDVVDQFVADGVIVSTVTRRHAVSEYRATEAGTHPGLPLAILINGASASAAEIVAGSLQAMGRATVVGTRSFGKGSVQHLIHLRNHQAAVKLTTAYYRLPDGRFIHRTPANTATSEWGIIPNVVVTLDEEEAAAVADARHALDMDALDAFWPQDNDRHRETRRARDTRRTSPMRHTLPVDRQLNEAVRILMNQVESVPPRH